MISVIIVNYDGKHLLKSCLESVRGQSFTDFEIILVDNASKDGSVDYVREAFPGVKLVALPTNTGFAGGNIEGLKASHGDYIMLLNNDVEVDRHCLKNLHDAMVAEPIIGVCASKMVVHGTDFIDSAGDGYLTILKGFKRGEGEMAEKYEREEYVFGACAGAALYRRRMIDEIGFLDPDFFLIHEDTDLNFRAQRAGWKVLFVPSAVAYHKVRSTIGHMSDTAVYYSLRNNEWVRIKNIPFRVFLRCFPAFLFYQVAEFIYFALRHGKIRLYMKAKFDAVRFLPRMLRKRREIREKSRVTNGYLLSMITSPWTKDFLRNKAEKFFFRKG